MRALMPGINFNYVKPFFTEYNILTVHSIILTNILIFMNKYRYSRKSLPPLFSEVISSNAPIYDHINADSEAWKISE